MASRRIKPKKPLRIGLAVLLGSALLPRIGSVVADVVDYYPGSGEKQETTAPLGGSRNMLERRESITGEHRCRRNITRALLYVAVFAATGCLSCCNQSIVARCVDPFLEESIASRVAGDVGGGFKSHLLENVTKYLPSCV